jgi:hypothetical protein
MADKKYDGVVEAVRMTPEGKVKLIRVYLRRGNVWTDRMLLTRDDFVAMLKSGKRMMIGQRVALMAGTFDVTCPIQIDGADGQEVLYTSQPATGRDSLDGASLF